MRLRPEHAQALLPQVDPGRLRFGWAVGLRDGALLALVAAGLSAVEIAALKASAVTLHGGRVVVSVRRHGVTWSAVLPTDLGGRLLAWLSESRLWTDAVRDEVGRVGDRDQRPSTSPSSIPSPGRASSSASTAVPKPLSSRPGAKRTPNFPSVDSCAAPPAAAQVRAERLEQAFSELLQRIEISPGMVRLVEAALLDIWHELRAESSQQSATAKKRIAELERRKQRLVQAYVYDQAIDRPTYDRELTTLDEALTFARRATGRIWWTNCARVGTPSSAGCEMSRRGA